MEFKGKKLKLKLYPLISTPTGQTSTIEYSAKQKSPIKQKGNEISIFRTEKFIDLENIKQQNIRSKTSKFY